jgi:hypothetical protein
MLSIIVSALWTIISADNFAIPVALFHMLTGSTGSA